ncbi:MAG: hypothetical protein IAF94_02760 [Pirellulaceae bacterium]|nr:hypothetical protein [Pirellulaceae bacterium]
MSEVQELQMRIRNLPSEDRALLREWFYEFDNELWDRQIQADFKAGKFTSLIDEARKEFAEGPVREL